MNEVIKTLQDGGLIIYPSDTGLCVGLRYLQCKSHGKTCSS